MDHADQWLPGLPWLLAAVTAAIALFVMARQLHRARLIEDMPTSRIRSAAQGGVELNGTAHALDREALLEAPLTRTACLWFSFTIERSERSRQGHRWRVIERGSSAQPFQLDDRTGRCLVDPADAEVTTVRRQQWRGTERRPLHRLLPLAISGTYRYTERRIEEGDWLYVLGWLETPRRPTFNEEAAVGQRQLLTAWKADQPTLLRRFDADRDGLISLEEWEKARAVAATEAARVTLTREVAEPLPVIRRPDDRSRPFLIASEDPQQLIHRFRGRALLALVVGSVVAAGFASGLFLG